MWFRNPFGAFRTKKSPIRKRLLNKVSLMVELLERRELLSTFGAGNLVVSRVGTGTGALGATVAATFLDEYTTAGAAVGNSIALPSAGNTFAITNATSTTTTATITTASATGFAVGNSVVVAGVTPAGYNGTFAITAVTTSAPFTFTYALTTNPGAFSNTGTPTATVSTSSLTLLGTTTTEGYLTDSADGHALNITGYNQVIGGTTTNANRDVGVIGPTGTTGVTTQMPSATGSVRVAVSADSLGFWIASSVGVRYVPFGNAAATASIQLSTEVTSVNAVAIDSANPSSSSAVPGQLFASAGAAANAATGVPALDSPFTVGSNLPTNAGQGVSVSPSFPTARDAFNNFPSSNQFAISPDGNTIYIADSRVGPTDTKGGLLKYYQGSPNLWTLINSSEVDTTADGGLRGLVADFSGTQPVLYATTTNTTQNRLVKFVDNGDLLGNGGGFTISTLATAPANEAFRGVAFTPTAAGATVSSTSLLVSNSPGSYGSGATLTATVTSGATGWVSFRNGSVEVGAAPIVSGQAVLNTAGNLAASASAYNITAVYTGDTTYAASTSSAQAVTINKASTTTTLTVSNNPVATGVNDTLTATLVGIPAGTSASGTVTFKDGAATLGTGTVAQSVVNQSGSPVIIFTATFTGSFSTLGTHSLSAVYGGDTNFLTSTGTASVLVVSATTTAVTSDAASAAASGATVHFTATITSTGAGTISGSLQFYDDLLPIGSAITVSGPNTGTVANVNATTALLQGTGLTPGLHSITAIYTPDGTAQNNYFGSSGVLEQTVQVNPFAAGDQFVYRVGDGTTNLVAQAPNANAGTGSIGSTIYVDEYTPGGTLIQSIILPSADGTGAQNTIHAVVGNGQQSTTGQMTLSGDGQYLFLTGYDNNPLNTATALEVRNSAVSRSIARIKYDGTIQTIAFKAGATGSGGVQTGGNFDGVFSPDGNQFYVSGFNGVNYSSTFAPSSALQTPLATQVTSFTVLGLENNGTNLAMTNLNYATNVNLVGTYTGFPTAAATAAQLPLTVGADTQQFPIDVYFTHLNGSGAPAGVNTMYISDDGPGFAGGRITKWALVSGTWTLVDNNLIFGTGNTAITPYWLNGVNSGGTVTLYSTYANGGNANAGPGFLYSLTDSNGWNAPIGTGGVHSDTINQIATVSSTSKILAPFPGAILLALKRLKASTQP